MSVVEVSRGVPTCRRQMWWLGHWGFCSHHRVPASASSAPQWDRDTGAKSEPLFPGAWDPSPHSEFTGQGSAVMIHIIIFIY